jgi:hypothetical protein
MNATEAVNAVEVWYVDADEPVRAFVLGHAENAYDRERGFVDVRRPGYTGGTNPERLYPTAGEANLAALANVRESLAATRMELRRLSHRELALEALTRAEPRCAGDVDREFAAVVRDDDADDGEEIDTHEHGEPVGFVLTDEFRRAADIEAATPITAGDPWFGPRPGGFAETTAAVPITHPMDLGSPAAGTHRPPPFEDCSMCSPRGQPVPSASGPPDYQSSVPRRPATDHLEPRGIADRRVEHGERGETAEQARA